jgi:hypothetical protein
MNTVQIPRNPSAPREMLDRDKVVKQRKSYWFVRRTQDIVISSLCCLCCGR